MYVAVMISLTGLEWWRYFNPSPPTPILYSIMLVGVMLYAVWTIWRVIPTLRQLRLASEGEKAVGQYFERLRENGYQVFHDVIGQGFNLDHVLIGPAGVFTIETKTLSKPERGDAKIVFDGSKLLVAGFEPDRNPIIQAKAQAKWLSELLAESTGHKFFVRPVVVYPGWYIEQASGATRDIWVLEPKALPGFLAKIERALCTEDVKLASYHLSRFIREQQKSGNP